ncbi:HIT domain-containing protein [Ancylobacter terrae]|uniref:HIT domain-containing protein n=1 Tax=Ancylobacter sp. sgz301288 TaxID=3342077 RepID=UPI00385ED9B0
MSPHDAFQLDPRLEADTLYVGEAPLSTIRLLDDSRFPWIVLVPRRPGVVDLRDLDAQERTVLMEEIVGISGVLKAMTQCDKLNVGTLGNVVPQLHVHIVARFQTDDAWPRPVWGHGKRELYDEAVADALLTRLRAELGVR